MFIINAIFAFICCSEWLFEFLQLEDLTESYK